MEGFCIVVLVMDTQVMWATLHQSALFSTRRVFPACINTISLLYGWWCLAGNVSTSKHRIIGSLLWFGIVVAGKNPSGNCVRRRKCKTIWVLLGTTRDGSRIFCYFSVVCLFVCFVRLFAGPSVRSFFLSFFHSFFWCGHPGCQSQWLLIFPTIYMGT